MDFFNNFFGNKKPVKPKYSSIDYNIYFESSAIDGTVVELLPLGDLVLTTGEIIACDPLVFLHDSLPFTRKVKPGKYPVTACIAKTESSGDRYAIVKLEFTKAKPTIWEMALLGKQDPVELKEEEFFGFPVDAGLGCFCDLETQKLYTRFLSEFYQKNPNGNIYDDFFAAEFKKNALDMDDASDIGDWLNFRLPNGLAHNIIMFHAGYGDGAYPSFWGTTDNREICCLIIDFQVL
jgi:hypothetical protein